MHSSNTKDMKKLFENWRGHNSQVLTEVSDPDDPDAIPLSTAEPGEGVPKVASGQPKKTSDIPLSPGSGVPQPDQPIGDEYDRISRALRQAGINTPADRIRMFGGMTGPVPQVEFPPPAPSGPARVSVWLFFDTADGKAAIEIGPDKKINFWLPEEVQKKISPKSEFWAKLWNIDELVEALQSASGETLDKADPGNTRIINSLSRLADDARGLQYFASSEEAMEALAEVNQGPSRLKRAIQSVAGNGAMWINYFTPWRNDAMAAKRLASFQKSLRKMAIATYPRRMQDIGQIPYNDRVAEIDRLYADEPPEARKVRVDKIRNPEYTNLTPDSKKAFIQTQEALKDTLAEEIVELNNKKSHRPSWWEFGNESLDSLAASDPCDKKCQKAIREIELIDAKVKYKTQQIEVINTIVKELANLNLPQAGFTKKAISLFMRTVQKLTISFTAIFKWMAGKFAWLLAWPVAAAGIVAMLGGVAIIINEWKKYTRYFNELYGKAAHQVLAFLAWLSNEDPTGFFGDLMVCFFSEAALSAARKTPEQRNDLEGIIARSMERYFQERLMGHPSLYPQGRDDDRLPDPRDEPNVPAGTRKMEEILTLNKSLKIVLG
jgi:hypothetical protein